ncbi:hypothetical protein FQR65_LT07468 [Abscondita terminalis]|nr:hypothetical protein FQR65_LT07468 [Abscondita terminalis]
MSSGRYPRGLPPQHPSAPRKSVNSPLSPPITNNLPSFPNRSRSLDGLLDNQPLELSSAEDSEKTPSESSHISQSCDSNIDIKISDENINIDKETEPVNKRNSNLSNSSSRTQQSGLEDSLDSNDISKSSDLSINSNSSDNQKQKRKFMNRCYYDVKVVPVVANVVSPPIVRDFIRAEHLRQTKQSPYPHQVFCPDEAPLMILAVEVSVLTLC